MTNTIQILGTISTLKFSSYGMNSAQQLVRDALGALEEHFIKVHRGEETSEQSFKLAMDQLEAVSKKLIELTALIKKA